MNIYTSYFAQLKKLPSGIVPISICGKAPDWYKGLQYKKLAPKYNFFMKYKEDHNVESYTKSFQAQVLDKLKIAEVFDDFIEMGRENDIVLLCYEKPNDFCHRHLVAKWISESTGYDIREIKLV